MSSSDRLRSKTEIASAIPPEAARQYVSTMLAELCEIAKETEQTDLLALLNLTSHAVDVMVK